MPAAAIPDSFPEKLEGDALSLPIQYHRLPDRNRRINCSSGFQENSPQDKALPITKGSDRIAESPLLFLLPLMLERFLLLSQQLAMVLCAVVNRFDRI